MFYGLFNREGRALLVRLFQAGVFRLVPRMKGVSVLIPLAFMPSCSSFQDSSGGKAEIRYANLSILIDAELEGNSDWLALSVRKKVVQKRLDEIRSSRDLTASPGAEDRDLSKELEDILKREIRQKRKVYPEIYSALKSVAKRRKYDFILNIDENLLYAGSSFDVTGDVLQELKVMRARSDPLVR